MKRFAKVILLVILVSAASGASAQAAIYWDWGLYNDEYYAMPGDTIFFNSYLENLNTSTENIVYARLQGAAFVWNLLPASFQFGYNGDFWTQFQSIDLPPGGSFDFLFGNIHIYNDAAYGTYVPVSGMVLAEGADPRVINRPITVHIGPYPEPVIPEPASLLLLGLGILGLAGLKLKG